MLLYYMSAFESKCAHALAVDSLRADNLDSTGGGSVFIIIGRRTVALRCSFRLVPLRPPTPLRPPRPFVVSRLY